MTERTKRWLALGAFFLVLGGTVLLILAGMVAQVRAAEIGRASYYAHAHHGLRTASGERFDMHALTAAHRTLPFGALVRVENLSNGRSVTVRINDRGPFVGGRIIDVSIAAARQLGMVRSGTAPVRITRR